LENVIYDALKLKRNSKRLEFKKLGKNHDSKHTKVGKRKKLSREQQRHTNDYRENNNIL